VRRNSGASSSTRSSAQSTSKTTARRSQQVGPLLPEPAHQAPEDDVVRPPT
jgi:hypothetical protein